MKTFSALVFEALAFEQQNEAGGITVWRITEGLEKKWM